MAGIFTMRIAALLLCLSAIDATSPRAYEVDIEVNNSSGLLDTPDQQKAFFRQLKEKVASSLKEQTPQLREIPEEENKNPNTENKGPGNDDVKRIEAAPPAKNSEAHEVNNKNRAKSWLTNIVPLLKLNSRRSFLVEPSTPAGNNSDKKTVEILEYTDDLLKIGTDRNLFLTVVNNLETIKYVDTKGLGGPLEGITIYKDPDTGKFTDFWHKVIFEEKDGVYKDSTGVFSGILKGSWEDLVKDSKLGKSGFFIDSSVTMEAEELMVYRSKKLIVDLAYSRKMKVSELMARNKPLETLESAVMYNLYPLRPNDILEVCVCRNNDCKLPCTEVQRMERKNFI